MDPIAFRIGPLAVHWYGLLIVTGAVLAAVVATFEAKRRGEDPEHVWNIEWNSVDCEIKTKKLKKSDGNQGVKLIPSGKIPILS